MRSLYLLPLILLLFGATAAAPVGADASQELHLARGVISSVEGKDGVPVPTTSFHVQDHIYYFTEVRWDDPGRPAGTHQLQYKWYSGDKLALSFGDTKTFEAMPYYWFAYVTGGHLGEGHHRAELYVDDRLFDTREFDIVPAGVAVTGSAATAVMDEDHLRDSIKTHGIDLLLHGDTEGFDRLADGFRRTRDRSPAGIWKLSLLYNCLQKLPFTDPADHQWQRLEDIGARWVEAHPDSPAATIMYAKLLYAHAWAYRGNGFASDVHERNWAPYRELIERSRAALDRHRELAARDSEWDAQRIDIALEQGAEAEAIFAMASAALDREPYYYPIHYAAVRALAPRWQGSEEWIKRYVQLALDRSRDKEGTQVYARIYFDVARRSSDWVDELNQSGAKWPPMHQSLDEILRAWPDPWNLDTARALTCSLDREAYRSYGRRGGAATPSVAWFDTPQQRADCERWAFEGSNMPTGSLADQVRGYLSFLRGFGSPFWWGVKLAALLLFALVELVLWLRARAERAYGFSLPVTDQTHFDPALYPRSYRFASSTQPVSNRSAIAMAAMGAAAAWAVATIPWGNFEQDLAVFLILALAAAAGLYFLLRNLASRVVLRADAIEVHSLAGTRSLGRNLLIGWRTSGNIIVLETREPPGLPLPIREVAYADEAFKRWFASLPRLQPIKHEDDG